jgi:hypothetical protein
MLSLESSARAKHAAEAPTRPRANRSAAPNPKKIAHRSCEQLTQPTRTNVE